MKNIPVIALTLVVLHLLAACATVPMTGRTQANLSSEKNLVRMAESEYRRFLSQSTLCQDAEKVHLVQGVSDRIIDATRRYYAQNKLGKQFDRFKWEVNVIESEEVNAFCMPGGKIAVMTGMLAVTENEDQLAAVIGHEVGHAIGRHAQEKMSHGLLAEIGYVGVQVATVNSSADVQQTASLGYVVGATFGFMLPYSRKLEKEADNIGLRLMIMAGYDPAQAPKLWERMTEKLGDSKSAFFQTHPTNKTRKRELEEQIPAAIAFAVPYMAKPEQNPGDTQPAKPVIATAILPAEAPVGVRAAAAPATSTGFLPAGTDKAERNIISAPSGKYLVVQVEALNSHSFVPGKYDALKPLGTLEFETASLEGAPIKRVLLGWFTSLPEANKSLEAVKKQGFRDAYLIEYTDGVRGKPIH